MTNEPHPVKRLISVTVELCHWIQVTSRGETPTKSAEEVIGEARDILDHWDWEVGDISKILVRNAESETVTCAGGSSGAYSDRDAITRGYAGFKTPPRQQ